MSPEMRPKSLGTFEKQAPGKGRLMSCGTTQPHFASLPTLKRSKKNLEESK